jgi:hypothetical protein
MEPKRASLRTRMPIDHLTASDLLVDPIWEFAIDEEGIEGQDETWVRPVDAQAVRKGLWSLSVAADFRTSAGAVVGAFVGVTTTDGVKVGDGVLLHEGKYIFLDARSAASRRSTAHHVARRMMHSDLQPDPPPGALEKKIRIGCGALFGIFVGLYVAGLALDLRSFWVWIFALVGAVVFTRMALIYGHHFWFNILRILRGMFN